MFSEARGQPLLCVLGVAPESQWHKLVDAWPDRAGQQSVHPTDPALIYYTSGTTGAPKGVVLSHRALLFSSQMFSDHLRITDADCSLVTGSMAFILHLLLNALSCLTGGASLVLMDRFHPEVAIRAIEQHRISILMAVPTAYVMMLNWMDGKQPDLSSLRIAITAGASFPAALYLRALSGFGRPVFDLWGMTECAPMTTYNPARDSGGRLDSCGRPLPGCQVRVVDDDFKDLPVGEVGEVLLRSPAIMTEYYSNPKATQETIVDGWVRSGDLGKVDDEGFLYIVGRKKDMIIRGGSNIYPVDIEEVLYAHDGVAECAVIGVPDQTFGEVVKAFVVLKQGAVATPSDMADYCRKRIAEYKVPSEIELVDSLPKGPAGKILRRELRDRSM